MRDALSPLDADVTRDTYKLLNDEPVLMDRNDLLDTKGKAERISSLLYASRGSSPFVLAIDAGWGMGKSTLLRNIKEELARKGARSRSNETKVLTLYYNAWTAEGENALEGLIKSVLGSLDPNTMRRWIRSIARKHHLMLLSRIAITIAANFFGVTRMVDELWSQLGGDSDSLNEMRGALHEKLSEWAGETEESDFSGKEEVQNPARMLVVFIDDLDRCSDDVVLKVCEAVRLYLDARGLIFVIACDQSILARRVSSSVLGGSQDGYTYLEKIVQVVYRVPIPTEGQIKNLIESYAQKSGIADLIDENVIKVLTEGSNRNPRTIKRVINSFVLEHTLDDDRQESSLDSAQLMRAVLLQQLYSIFYELLVRDEAAEKNTIDKFLDFMKIREGIVNPSDRFESWLEDTKKFFSQNQTKFDPRSEVADQMGQLEKNLPEIFPILARDPAFIALIGGIGNAESRKEFIRQLADRPLVTAPSADEVDIYEDDRITLLERRAAELEERLLSATSPETLTGKTRFVAGENYEDDRVALLERRAAELEERLLGAIPPRNSD
jgi:KAP family P-loop domain